MTQRDRYEVYFRRPDDAIVFAAAEQREVSLVHRNTDGSWHCALCDAADCPHITAARAAKESEAA